MQEKIKDINWVLAPYPVDESFVKLEIDEEFIGRYTGSKPNPNFKDDLIHVFEDINGDIKQINGTTNLDRWISVIDPGNMVKIRRFKDKIIGQPKPLQVYKVWIQEEP